MPNEKQVVADELEAAAKRGANYRLDQPGLTVIYQADVRRWVESLRGT